MYSIFGVIMSISGFSAYETYGAETGAEISDAHVAKGWPEGGEAPRGLDGPVALMRTLNTGFIVRENTNQPRSARLAFVLRD